MRILREETTAVVIDIQERLLPHIHDGERMLANCIKLIEGMRILDIPVIVTQQYTKGLGPTVPQVTGLFNEFSHVEKITFSCCDEPSFLERTEKTRAGNFVICGIETHVCVLQTCLDLLAAGKVTVVVEDCVSSRKPEDKRIALERMRQEGAVVTSLESILFELARVAGTPAFKSISGLVK